MPPSPNPNLDPVRGAVSPALGAGGGVSVSAPAKSFEELARELARELVYRTPSEFDSILLLLTGKSVQYASKGQYGGWIVRGQLTESDIIAALWSFEQEWKDIEVNAINNDVAKKFLEELARHGFDFNYVVNVPKARIIRYKYKPVEVKVKKATDRYTVER